MMAARCVTHGPTPVLVVRVNDHLRALGPQVRGQVLSHVEVELRLGVAAVGFGTGGVARLRLAAVEDGRVDDDGSL